MIDISKERLAQWRSVTLDAPYGCMTKVVKLSGLSHPTVLRAVRTGRATPKAAKAISAAVDTVRKELISAM